MECQSDDSDGHSSSQSMQREREDSEQAWARDEWHHDWRYGSEGRQSEEFDD